MTVRGERKACDSYQPCKCSVDVPHCAKCMLSPELHESFTSNKVVLALECYKATFSFKTIGFPTSEAYKRAEAIVTSFAAENGYTISEDQYYRKYGELEVHIWFETNE